MECESKIYSTCDSGRALAISNRAIFLAPHFTLPNSNHGTYRSIWLTYITACASKGCAQGLRDILVMFGSEPRDKLIQSARLACRPLKSGIQTLHCQLGREDWSQPAVSVCQRLSSFHSVKWRRWFGRHCPQLAATHQHDPLMFLLARKLITLAHQPCFRWALTRAGHNFKCFHVVRSKIRRMSLLHAVTACMCRRRCLVILHCPQE